ncbi:MoxR-like ATPase [Clostridium cavendishii DSM 21758]|uniref:MoxR-like ATPase n=1 Tax=Clostridium cavendishii DSM 21758 TaxID=1121302 RepID=A0A1M6TT75_9CLOT|nr:MoxR family ATPase [Clostridium cavendishii]SHK60141.1 MoxR-like ATPase [Clostridium cavendishii DSM 21758]
MEIRNFVEFRSKLQSNISKVIIGKEREIDKIIVALICSGHVLLEDMPGLGKTKLAKSISKSLNCDFKRIQFTPDILPSDLTGIYFYNQKSGDFEFKKGPLVTNIILADEINRATPRTQSALLECMEERQITVEGNSIALEKPFFVIATQNPIEQFGTFPLPEAQLDRFFIRISLGYPEYQEEKKIMDTYISNDPLEILDSVISNKEIDYVQNNYKYVEVKDEIKNYILDIVSETRKNYEIEYGVSPRATLALMKASQAHAAINGRDYVVPEDVKVMATAVLAHRIQVKINKLKAVSNPEEDIINSILNKVTTPLESLE